MLFYWQIGERRRAKFARRERRASELSRALTTDACWLLGEVKFFEPERVFIVRL